MKRETFRVGTATAERRGHAPWLVMLAFLDAPASPCSSAGSEIVTTCLPFAASTSSSPKSGEWLTACEPQRFESTPARSTNGLVARPSPSTYAKRREDGALESAFAVWQDGDRVRRSEA